MVQSAKKIRKSSGNAGIVDTSTQEKKLQKLALRVNMPKVIMNYSLKTIRNWD